MRKLALLMYVSVAALGVAVPHRSCAEGIPGATDITGKTVYLAPNARLRYGESLLDRVYARTNATMKLVGAGQCSAFNCPVLHNGQQVFARRGRLDTEPPSTGLVVTERTLRYRAEGADVVAIQKALEARGYSVEADGKFGWRMLRAVRAFQRDHGIKPDGHVGPRTRKLLLN